MKDIKVNFVDSQGQDLNLQFPQTYRDQTIGALGTSYRIGNWTLRAGYRQGTKAAQGSQLFATLPVTPTKHITTGFSYQVSASSRVDFAYDHALQETTYNSVLPNTAVPIKNTHSQDNFVLCYTYDF